MASLSCVRRSSATMPLPVGLPPTTNFFLIAGGIFFYVPNNFVLGHR